MQAIPRRCEHCEHTFLTQFNFTGVSNFIAGSIFMGANTPCSACSIISLPTSCLPFAT